MEVKPIDQYRFARALCIVAHPDDEALFAGATLRKLANQHCEIGIVVCTSVAETNAAPILTDDRARQQRRLVAFGRACGMIGVSRTWMLDCPNATDGEIYTRQIIAQRLLPIVEDFQPAFMLTHGADGEYGHQQHINCNVAVNCVGGPPRYYFSATGHAVPVDLAWKKRLLDCYRYGTTQDAHWSPYFRQPGSPLEPWLGDRECFEYAG